MDGRREDRAIDPGRIERVAVIGAGLMGHGIAQVFAQHGCSVMLYDVGEDLLKNALERIRSNLKLYVEAGVEDEGVFETVLSRIKTTTKLPDAVARAQFVTEAVPENLDLKMEVFQEIDAATDKNVIMASNTSTLSITRIGESIKKSDRLLMTHWFNPPHLIPVVEVVKGESTSEEAFTSTFRFLKEMGKEPVHVLKQVPGLLVNRIQTAMFREIVGLLQAGVAHAEDIDKAVRGSFGIRLAAVGPLTTVDLAGVDLWYLGSKHLYPLFDDSKEPQKVLHDMVAAGSHGVKTGKGFFEYGPGRAAGIIKDRDITLIKMLDLLYDKEKEGDKA